MTHKSILWIALGSLFISPIFLGAVDQTNTNKGANLKTDFQSGTHQKYTIPSDYKEASEKPIYNEQGTPKSTEENANDLDKN